jgi:hypothetical protein
MSAPIKGKLTIQNSNGSGTAVELNGNALPQTGAQVVEQQFPTVGGGALKPDPSFLTGQLDIKDSTGKVVISLGVTEVNVKDALTSLGGFISINDSNDQKRIELNASKRSLTLHKPRSPIKLDAENGIITNGRMKLMADGEIEIPFSMHLEKGQMRLGAETDGQGNNGGLMIRNSDGKVVIVLDAADRTLHVLDNLKLDNGVLRLGSEPGGGGPDGMLFLRNASGKETVRLDGKAGDLIFRNADCAEDFDIASDEIITAGTVMVLNDEGKLGISHHAYDKRVAGVVSGGGHYKPGIILDRQPEAPARQPIALMGKVFCKVDARRAPIAVGDLLTTSPTPGHAMRADDPMQAFGAVLGKALRPLAEGLGMIPVLVSLQ